jgi:hypothetical protein
VPTDVPAWAEGDFSALQNDQPVSFDPQTDLPPPLYGGAVVERGGGNRLVVVGTPTFAFNFELSLVDPVLARQGQYVTRFPANAELFMNSVFWLAREETMIALSPAAMEVSRIQPMSPGMLKFWRVGVMLIGIPGAVLAAGLVVYLRRRD